MGGDGRLRLAGALHVSGPIAVVVAGLLIGNHGVRLGMSARSAEHVRTFWHLIDETQRRFIPADRGGVFALSFGAREALIALVTIPLVLVARAAAVSLPIGLLRWAQPLRPAARRC